MRVLHFSPRFSPHDRRFIAALAARGHELHYLCLNGGNDPPSTLPQGVAYAGALVPSDVNVTDVAALLPKFIASLRSIGPDLLEAGPLLSCALVASLSKFRPFVAISFGHDILIDAEQSDETRRIACSVLQAADAIICDCETVRRQAIRLGRLSQPHFIQFPWGIELERFTPPIQAAPIRQQLGWQNNCIFISARSWEKLYDILTLMEGFRVALESAPELRLVLIGDGSLHTQIKAFIKEKDIAHAVYLPGRIEERALPAYLAVANAYVSSAITDGSSITLLEAMACSLPAIVTDIPSNREWITEQSGWLYPPHDSKRLARAMVSVAVSNDLLRFGTRNRTIVSARADWNANANILDAGLKAIAGLLR